MSQKFEHVINTEVELREIMGHPSELVANKAIHRIDRFCKAFIGKSPFVVISSCGADGTMDVSPKGDPAGFVQVLDETTLAIPERPGNRRADTFSNVLSNPKVSLIFMIPGKTETLRVRGTAQLVRDQALREQMAVRGRVPELALVISVQEVFFHCSKCMVRSKLWKTEEWPDVSDLPSLARIIVEQGRTADSIDETEAMLQRSEKDYLY